MNTKKACIISLVAISSLYATAESAFFISTNSSSAVSTYKWGDVANWADESDTPLTVAPTNGQDIVFGATLHNEAYLLRTSTGVTVGNDSSAAIANGADGYLPTEKAEKAGHYSAYITSGYVGHVGGDLLVREQLKEINEMFNEDEVYLTK